MRQATQLTASHQDLEKATVMRDTFILIGAITASAGEVISLAVIRLGRNASFATVEDAEAHVVEVAVVAAVVKAMTDKGMSDVELHLDHGRGKGSREVTCDWNNLELT
jgi:hypothetical protein